MFYIIEKLEQLNNLGVGNELFIHPIMGNDNIHPILDNVCSIYIKDIITNLSYILILDHSESQLKNKLKKIDILNFFNNINKVYVLNKKLIFHTFLYNVSNTKFIDLLILNNLYNIIPDFLLHKTRIEEDFSTKFENMEYNKLIPISKHYEKFENNWDNINKLIYYYNNEDISKFDYYNNDVVNFFYNIEKNGIKINNNFTDYFNINVKNNIKNNKLYLLYNLNTTTFRPSNSFNKLNFSSLRKNSDERLCFVPENNCFLEIDFKSYHPAILSKIINYKFEEDSIYDHLKKYIPDDTKKITLSQIYGGINKKYLHIPFFNEINKVIKNPQTYFPLTKNFINDNENKNLSYYIQNTETIYNVLIYSDLLTLLNNRKSNVVLYNYDSILIDLDYQDKYDVYDYIKQIPFKFTMKIGNNYKDLQEVQYL